VNSPVVGASVAAGSSVAPGASVAAGSSVATGGASVAVAGAGAQAVNTMLATTSKLNRTNSLRILLLLTKFERFDLERTHQKPTNRMDQETTSFRRTFL
jgi:hypothetical protein